ncbi:type I-G CRISPR-associated protein Csb2 [Sphaerisporangium fuscum]|uniref:type I-G CRISPR-associated protein Csb2 n=1 Tax=Sphaerisporangium fuscum TaxID=2835868 RepID=UPI001BDBE464|nr:type I-U CRISPR-associated protein Csb2 [Sphaerisporangium fuscum]
MPVAITVRLRTGRYEAAGMRPSHVEWPPHPARLFCALVASAVDDDDWAVLRWLETAGVPEVWACQAAGQEVMDGYVVTNAIEQKGGSQFWPGRTNGPRSRVSAVPQVPAFTVVWAHVAPDADALAQLRRLARRVPYVGRATSTAILSVAPEIGLPGPEWTRYVPSRIGEHAHTELRIPYPGYTDQLQRAYADGQRAWAVARSIPYTVAGSTAKPAAAAGPFSDLVVFRFEPRVVRPAGDSLLTLTARLRQAVIQRIGTDVPAEVSGHGADDRKHLGYLALLNSGHDDADGHVLGVALAVPREMAPHALDRLLARTVDDPIRRLTIRRDQTIALDHDPYLTSPLRLTPEWWMAAPQGSRSWVTVAPLMLDRYPSRKQDAHSLVFQSLTTAGYPEPEEVEISPAALTQGAVSRPRQGTIPQGRPVRPMVHARVTFAQPVIGPVLAGSMRYLGLGLFMPDRSNS